MIDPVVVGRSPEIAFSNVLFPAALLPTNATIWAGFTTRLISRSTGTVP
jgi:hypothetical protein